MFVRLLLCGLVIGALVGCGGNSGGAPTAVGSGPIGARPSVIRVGTSSAPGGGPAASIDSCALLSDAEIEAATGQRVTERTPSTLTQVFSSVCDIELDGGGFLTVSVLPTGGRAMYETSFEPFIGDSENPPLDEAVEGLGDKAGIQGDDDIMVLKDDVLFDIFYIAFGQQGKAATIRYLAERVLAKLPCLASGCPDLPLPPMPTLGPVASGQGGPPVIDPGALPSTGAQARVVNLYSEEGQPIELDVYAYMWSDGGLGEVGALVATVPYGQASAWFNPGLVQTPFSEEQSTRVEVFRHGEHEDQLVGIGEFLGPGTVTTIAVWQEELFEGQPGAWAGTIYAEHPDYTIPEAPPGKGLLVSRNDGLDAEEDPPFLYASVGNGCLESPIERSIPDIPNVQPVGNDLALPVGQHTLEIHGEPPIGELATCKDKPLGPGVPITVNAGDRLLAFPYRLPGTTEMSTLVIPFDK